MANKKSLLGGVTLKVENMSGFDKSRYNAFTAPLGSIVPMVKQLCLPGKVKCSVKISAQLPPLATDAFLRTHLKLEAFYVPFRLMYGGFQSWFAGIPVASSNVAAPASVLSRAHLPFLRVFGAQPASGSDPADPASQTLFDSVFGPHSLMDYFGVKYNLVQGHVAPNWMDPQISGHLNYSDFNLWPFVGYQLVYDQWYRNKLIERPLFSQPAASTSYSPKFAWSLPYQSFVQHFNFGAILSQGNESLQNGIPKAFNDVRLLNGHLLELRQRNYGFDYFTTCMPSAQDGNPMSVDTSSGSFTISALRQANALQHFAEINQVSGPDYLQTLRARYNRAPSSAVVSKPVLLGSADFPMFTSGVEQSAPYDTNSQQTANPFEGLGARFGRAHAEGQDFVCDFDVDEPGYFFVMASVVPEANYAIGISADMRKFVNDSLTDLPCAELERIGMQPVYSEEVGADDSDGPTGLDGRAVFGYQLPYTWHKAGALNEVHGLFRAGASLESFIPQRLGVNGVFPTQINTAFLKVTPDALDNVTAVSGAISQYGVMIDSAISLYVSEPLGESVMPSLVDPASEHGQSVYVKRGGQSIDN